MLPRELTLVRPPEELSELALRCIQRSRTPATALKKLVEPAASVREIASRVGASCCSSLRSWMPSERRSPMSETTDGFSLHGCLCRCDERSSNKRRCDVTYRASTMSNSKGSVTRSHTSYACDFLNSWIQSMLKSCCEFGSPEPSVMTTPLP